jgi:hypothetical protein
VAISGATGATLSSFFAYNVGFTGGVRVATVDANGDGRADILTAAGPGGGPHVRALDALTLASYREFFAYNIGFTGGVLVAGGNPNLSGSPQLADGGALADSGAASITDADLQGIRKAAIARWAAADLDAQSAARLLRIDVRVSDLPGAHLGLAQANAIYIDANAAGHGWFVDATPAFDEEFAAGVAIDPRAAGRMDLLSTVLHEMGHVLGYDDLDPILHPDDLMSATFGTGLRRTPSQSAADSIFATDGWDE